MDEFTGEVSQSISCTQWHFVAILAGSVPLTCQSDEVDCDESTSSSSSNEYLGLSERKMSLSTNGHHHHYYSHTQFASVAAVPPIDSVCNSGASHVVSLDAVSG